MLDTVRVKFPIGPTEEQLAGWPESKVYWAAKVGPSVGLAPLDLCPDPIPGR